MKGGEKMSNMVMAIKTPTVSVKKDDRKSQTDNNSKNKSGNFIDAMDDANEGADTTNAANNTNSAVNKKDAANDTAKKTAGNTKKTNVKPDTEKTEDDKPANATAVNGAKNNIINMDVLPILAGLQQNSKVLDNVLTAKISLPSETEGTTAASAVDTTGKLLTGTLAADGKSAILVKQPELNIPTTNLKDNTSILQAQPLVSLEELVAAKAGANLTTKTKATNNLLQNAIPEPVATESTMLPEQGVASSTKNITALQNQLPALTETLVKPLNAEMTKNGKQNNDMLLSGQAEPKDKNVVKLNVIDLTAKQGTDGSSDFLSAGRNMQQSIFSAKDGTLAAGQKEAPNQTGDTFAFPSFVSTMKDAAQNISSAAPQSAQQQNNAQDSYDIAGQIIKNAQLIKANENSQMTINLQPEHLGELSLKISVAADGLVNASFHSDNAQVRNLLQSTIVQLRQDLQDQGIKVDNINVYSGLSDLLSNGQNNNGKFSDKEQKKSSYRIGQLIEAAGQMDNFSTVAASTDTQNQKITSNGIDYRI